MTISELIASLQEMAEVYGEETEVRLMTQQNWPFENNIRGVTATSIMNDASEYDEPEVDEDGTAEEKEDDKQEEIIYIVEGGQICYGNKAAWDNC